VYVDVHADNRGCRQTAGSPWMPNTQTELENRVCDRDRESKSSHAVTYPIVSVLEFARDSKGVRELASTKLQAEAPAPQRHCTPGVRQRRSHLSASCAFQPHRRAPPSAGSKNLCIWACIPRDNHFGTGSVWKPTKRGLKHSTSLRR
jgi:hypothetical protein